MQMREKLWKFVHSEIFSYIFWGVTTTLVNIIVYTVFCQFIEYWVANIVAIITGKVYAYFVNKCFVFKSKCDNLKELLKEIFVYILTRGFSGLVDFFGVVILVEGIGANENIAKYIITVIVMILNYVFGKMVVFTSKKGDK